MQNTYIDALSQLAHMERLNIRFTDIRPGFVATPLLAGDGHYPMLMQVGKVAARIMKVLKRAAPPRGDRSPLCGHGILLEDDSRMALGAAQHPQERLTAKHP